MDDLKSMFTLGLGKLLARSRLISGEKYEVHVIINPRAGGLRNRKHRERLAREMDACSIGNKDDRIWPVALHYTERTGHGIEIVARIMNQSQGGTQRVLLVSVGGDGSHNECLSGLMLLGIEDRSRALVFRFPLGTGNDGADAWTSIQAFECLRDGRQTGKLGAVVLRRPELEPRYAFNIASFGTDAFVGHMTNMLKGIIPGSFYKIMTDLSVLIYLGTMKNSEVHYVDATSGETRTSSAVHALIAMGASGFRTYGHGIWILPGKENLCMVRRSGLIRNIMLKQQLFKASHVNLPETTVSLSSRVTIMPSSPSWVQVDGEVFSHDHRRGTLEFELVETGISCLSAKELSHQYLSQQALTPGADYLKS